MEGACASGDERDRDAVEVSNAAPPPIGSRNQHWKYFVPGVKPEMSTLR
jgi:hypothetical protein